MKSGYVKGEVADHIGRITFYHPAHNSLPGHLLRDLTAHISQLGEYPDCKVILLQSTGDSTFCAGASFEELAAIEDEKQGKAFFCGFAHVINAMRKCPKLIIGRVHGKAVGGGVGLIAAADYCIGLSNGSIKLSELALGIGPFVIGPVVERKIGLSAYSQLAISCSEWQTADWALRKGLYQELVDSTEDLDNHLNKLLHDLVKYNPKALGAFKKTLWAGTEDWDDLLEQRAAISGSLILDDAAQEAISAFKNRK